MKNNYPIKYAVIPFEEPIGYQTGVFGLEHEYGVVCYIATKCYVLSETQKYSCDGASKKEYEVVFPYELSNTKDLYIRKNPETLDAQVVNKVFETYEEAVNEANLCNEEILDDRTLMYSLSDAEELIQAYENKFKQYKELEKEIEKRTSDLVVEDYVTKQDIVIDYDAKTEIRTHLYERIQFPSDNETIIYTLPEGIYLFTKMMIELNGCIKQDFKETILNLYRQPLMYKEKDASKFKIANNESDLDKGSFYLENGVMKYDGNMYQFHKDTNFQLGEDVIKIYTTETFNDIVMSYIPEYVGDNEELNAKKYIKKINGISLLK